MKMRMPIRIARPSKALRGFSLIELLIAMTVLSVGLLGSMGIIFMASSNNGRSKLNTTAATLAESAMERIVTIPQSAAGAAAMTSMTDCAGTSFQMNTAPGGSPLVSTGAFADIDFNQPPVPWYSMLYTVCPAGTGISYDVRWRVDPGPTPGTQLVTVSAKPLAGNSSPAAYFSRPRTLHAYRGDR